MHRRPVLKVSFELLLCLTFLLMVIALTSGWIVGFSRPKTLFNSFKHSTNVKIICELFEHV
jgi:transcriptional regulator of met regulon